MAWTDEERHSSQVDALVAPEQATPGARALHPILDSGASIDMCRHSRFLINLRDLPSPMPIMVADGRPVFAYAVGDIDTEHIKLKDVYLVPMLKADVVVSVRQLAKINIVTTFYKNHAELWKEGELVGGAIACGHTSLYVLRFLRATGDDESHISPAALSGSEPWMFMAAATNHMTYKMGLVSGFEVFDCAKVFEDSTTVWSDRVKEKFFEDPFVGFGDSSLMSDNRYTAKFDQSDETGGGARCSNKSGGGSVHGKAHLGTDGMHEADFLKVQLNEHCLNA